MDNKKMNRKAQVTIFVILGIIIVISILALFLLLRNMDKQVTETANPKQFIESCINTKINAPLEKIMLGGGKTNPTFFLLYNGEKYNYLCYSSNIFERCFNLYPQFKTLVEAEIKKEIEGDVKECFVKLKDNYEKQGFVIKENELKLSIQILPGKILAEANKNVEIIKENDTQIFNKFNSYLSSELYDFVTIANDIVNEEVISCNFEYNGYMLGYPDYNVKITKQDNNKVYVITNRKSEKEFRFAVKGCAYPQGGAK